MILPEEAMHGFENFSFWLAVLATAFVSVALAKLTLWQYDRMVRAAKERQAMREFWQQYEGPTAKRPEPVESRVLQEAPDGTVIAERDDEVVIGAAPPYVSMRARDDFREDDA
jgi:hypothetical protein